ncbi:MAG: hypothetical protein AAFV85_23275 [Cyanobacteria bacterium J06634_6]
MTTAIVTTFATTTNANGSVIVDGYTWQCAYPVLSEDGQETFWRVSLADEAYREDSYFDELDSLDEAIAFITSGESDASVYAD